MPPTPETPKRSHQRKELPMIGVREFRDTFQTLEEPVKVIKSRRPFIEEVGKFYPTKRDSK